MWRLSSVIRVVIIAIIGIIRHFRGGHPLIAYRSACECRRHVRAARRCGVCAVSIDTVTGRGIYDRHTRSTAPHWRFSVSTRRKDCQWSVTCDSGPTGSARHSDISCIRDKGPFYLCAFLWGRRSRLIALTPRTDTNTH